jgi:hypothetical protein
MDFTFIEQRKSKASTMRHATRDELNGRFRTTLNRVKQVVRETSGIALRIQALLIRKALFVITSEKEGVFITTYNRVTISRM